jgi:hypothetical protein
VTGNPGVLGADVIPLTFLLVIKFPSESSGLGWVELGPIRERIRGYIPADSGADPLACAI